MSHSRTKKTEPFLQIPHKVIRSADYRYLSGSAVKLLNVLIFQFRGHNNGDLTAAWSVMKAKYGFRSPTTLHRAIRELLAADLILLTRQGGLGMCSLYSVSWLKINSCNGKLDSQPTSVPPRNVWHTEIRTSEDSGSVVAP